MFFPSNWQLSHITIVEITDSGERGMNPVAMTIINPRKEYCPSRESNQRPPALKSATLPTELKGSYLDFSHLTKLKYIDEKTIQIIKNQELKIYKFFFFWLGVPLKGYLAS